MLSANHLPLHRIGAGSIRQLRGVSHDSAVVEIAWLEAHGAVDAKPFDLTVVAGMNAETVSHATVMLHPATRILRLGKPCEFRWVGEYSDSHLLFTRPGTEVVVTRVDAAVAGLIEILDRPRALGELLEHDPTAATTLVTTGALASVPEILL